MASTSLLPSNWEVPAAIEERLGNRVGRQRMIAEEEHLLLVLHQPPKPDQPEREPALFWRRPDGSWMSDQSGSGSAGLEELLQKYDAVIDDCEQDESQAVTSQEYFSVLDRMSPIRRAAAHLYGVLQQAREMTDSDRFVINMRDRAYELERRAELLYSGTKNSLDYAVARRSEEQTAASNRMAAAAHRLNLLAAFFFPLVSVGSILGVNLTFPYRDHDSPIPFLVFLLVGLGCGSILTLVLMTTSRGKS